MRRATFAAVVLASMTAVAQPNKDQAAVAFADGQKRYAASDFLGAAAKFEAAYGLDPDPAYLFNVAQAYRLGNACAKAAGAYRKFLDAVSNPPNAAKVHQYLEQSEDCAKKQTPERPIVVAPPPNPPPPDHVVAPPRPPPRMIEPPVSERGHAQKLAGLGIGAVGVVVLGVGAYYSYRSFHLAGEREDFCAEQLKTQPMCAWDAATKAHEKDINDQGTAAEHRAWITLGVGGAALIGGALLYLHGRSAEHEHPQISVIPTSDGAMAFGSFAF